MITRGRRPLLRNARAVCATLAVLAASPLAHADPWIPASGDGSFEPMVRQYDATSSFPATGFSTSTHPSSEQRYTMYRITGTQGIGHGLSIEYDLRAAHADKIRYKHHTRLDQSASGAEDQVVGLNFGLRQHRSFADSIALNVVAPTGRVTSTPALGTGQTAIEPDYQLGLAGGRVFATMEVGSRVFLDGAAAQMRADLDVGLRLSHRLEVAGTLFLARTIVRRSPLPTVDAGEQYNVLRPGIRLKYRVTRHFRPFVGYENDFAGKAIHAGHRITIGFKVDY